MRFPFPTLSLLLLALLSVAQRAYPAVLELIRFNDPWKYNQTGADLGTAWRQPGFNDSAWPSGAGVLGFPNTENLLGRTTVGTVLNRYISGTVGPQVTNYYFRTTFQWTEYPQGVIMLMTNVLDDGAVFYLNGTEIARVAMPAGPINATTFATRNDDISAHGLDVLRIPPANLIRGENVLAVEVHQSTETSSDIIFGMNLWADYPFSELVIITTEPTNQTAYVGETVTFSVEVAGSPPYSFVWSKDGLPIPDATNATYTIPMVDFSDAGEYRVRVSNPESEDLSSSAVLTIGNAPVVLMPFNQEWRYEASGADLGTAWRSLNYNDSGWASGAGALGFPNNESLLGVATTATALNRYINGNSGAQVLTYYFRRTFQWTDSPHGVALLMTNLIDDGAVFYLNGAEIGRVGMPAGPINYTTSATRNDDISAHGIDFLRIEQTALVQGENVLAVEVHQGSETSSDLIFAMNLWAQLPAPVEGPVMIIDPPVGATNVVGESVTFSVNVVGTPPFEFAWSKNGQLIPGATNRTYLIAEIDSADEGAYRVRVSNAFGMEQSEPVLLVVVPSPLLLVPFDHEWRYEASGADLGTAWREVAYNDSAWPQGPGVLGAASTVLSEPIRTQVPLTDGTRTYYFRTAFEVDGDPKNLQLVATALIDDGVILYLNGVELTRLGMGAGQIVYRSLATRNIGVASPETLQLPTTNLVQGINVLAAEVHQAAVPGSDMVFGLQLEAQFLLPSVERREIVGFSGSWKYDQSGNDLGVAWRELNYNDSNWASGPSVLGYPSTEDLLQLASIQTLLHRYLSGEIGPQVTNYYFRRTFPWNGSPLGTTFFVTNLIDDGAVFYLNGMEIGRVGMPEGAITATTLATRNNDIAVRGADTLHVDNPPLVEGENVLAVEVHQGGPGSSDMIFGMSLWAELPADGPARIVEQPTSRTNLQGESVTFSVKVAGTPPYEFAWTKNGQVIPNGTNQTFSIPTVRFSDAGEYRVRVSNALSTQLSEVALLAVVQAPVVLVPFDHEWRYDASGTDLGTDWRQVSYNDSTWPRGPGALGFESSPLDVPIRTQVPFDETKITYYFRTEFEVDVDSTNFHLVAKMLIDDGVVLYLNGAEISRSGMPAGPVSYQTLGNRSVGSPGTELEFAL